MGDRSGNLSQVRTSRDKVRRKDLCGSVRAVYVLEKLLDVSGPGLVEAERYSLAPWPSRGYDARGSSGLPGDSHVARAYDKVVGQELIVS